jgi:glutamate formiminotransferase
VIECVVNVSEGRDLATIEQLAASAGPSLRDVHHDAIHHRSVLTLINDENDLRRDVRALAWRSVELLDLRDHEGIHPRIGVLDVVPFVALSQAEQPRAHALRDDTARWLGYELGLPAYLYGPERTLPALRRDYKRARTPDYGPWPGDPRSGAVAVGVRPVLMAWNIWLRGLTLDQTVALATSLRGPHLRTLGLPYGELTQLSCNLINPEVQGPDHVLDAVRARHGDQVVRCERVGLIPQGVLQRIDRSRWAELDVSPEATIESRL